MGVVEGEGLVVVVDLRHVRIGEQAHQQLPLAALARLDRAIAVAMPAAVPLVLVFPFLGVANAGLGFDVVEPGVLHARAAGPDVLAGHRAGVATDALVQVQHHGDLRAYLHAASPSFCTSSARSSPRGVSSQSTLLILRTTTNSSRLVPMVP